MLNKIKIKSRGFVFLHFWPHLYNEVQYAYILLLWVVNKKQIQDTVQSRSWFSYIYIYIFFKAIQSSLLKFSYVVFHENVYYKKKTQKSQFMNLSAIFMHAEKMTHLHAKKNVWQIAKSSYSE